MYFCHSLSNFRPWAFIRILETICLARWHPFCQNGCHLAKYIVSNILMKAHGRKFDKELFSLWLGLQRDCDGYYKENDHCYVRKRLNLEYMLGLI